MDLEENLTVEERNLKIAAQIGQSLLEQNNCLKLHAEELEAELSNANETITQLRHEISKKNQLIQLYSADLETTETEIESIDENSCSSSRDIVTGSNHNKSHQNNWEILQDQISFLENENLRLRSEASKRTLDIEAEERKEFLLIHDCAKQLIEANLQLINLQEELARRAEDNVNQHEEITNLLSQVVELNKKIRDLSQENEGLYSALDLAHECQNVLSGELLEVKEKYNVLMSAFQELQDEMKRKTETNLSNWPPPGSYMPFCESLAAELEDSLDSFGYESELPSLNRLNRKEIDESRSHSPDSMLDETRGYLKGKQLDSRSNSQQQRTTNLLGRTYLLSNKLRIVKSMEGSKILTQWQKMANPTLGSIFENTSGVQNRVIENVRTDLSNHIATTAGGSLHVAVTVSSMSINNQQKVNNTTTFNSNSNTNNNNNRIRLCKNNEGDGHSQDSDYSDEKSNPGKIFDTTLSTYTFTTTSLSLTSQTTLVTPSFGAVQLSTGHIIPISSVSTSTTSHDSSKRFNPKMNSNNLTVNDLMESLPSSPQPSASPSSPTAPTTSPQAIINSNDLASSSSNITNYHQPNVTSSTSSISVLFQDLLRNKYSNYVKYLSGALAAIELSSSGSNCYRDLTNQSIINSNNSVTCSPNSHHKGIINPSSHLHTSSSTPLPSPSASSSTSTSTPKYQSQNGLNYLASDGLHLATSSSPLYDSCDRGVITKGNTINPASIGVPDKDGSKDRVSAIELHRIVYYGKMLPLKTLRKGGLV